MKPDVAWLRLVTAAGTGFCSQQCSIKTILTVLHGIASLLDSAYKVSQTEERGPNTIAMVVVFPLSAICQHSLGGTPITDVQKGAIMSNETDKNQSKQEQGKQAPTGSVNTSDTKGSPSPGNQSQSNPAQDISKKNPPQGTDSQHQGQPKTEDEKRRAS